MFGDVARGAWRGEIRSPVRPRLGNFRVKPFDAFNWSLVVMTKCDVKKLEALKGLEMQTGGTSRAATTMGVDGGRGLKRNTP